MISDRAADARRAPIPMLLAIGAVRQHLVHTGLRARVGLVAEAGDAFDIHHFATLIGYGAEAVHPWLALATVHAPSARPRALAGSARRSAASALGRDGGAAVPHRRGEGAAQDPLEDGDLDPLVLLRGADLRGARPGPRGHRHLLRRHRVAHRRHRLRGARGGRAGPPRRRLSRAVETGTLPDYGRVRFRKDGEDHGWAPPVVVALQQAVKSGDATAYGGFLAKSAARRPAAPRPARGAGGHAGAAR